ncbi:MAG: penicillin acylase family protein [Desulfobacteraceae bacterium]|nr:MAG: penicillin acylase family protein [Desulfobacteraceae bacterium]
MKPIPPMKRLVFILSGMLLLVFTLAGIAYLFFIRLPMPPMNGEIRIAGLTQPVTVFRDRWSVPHLYAENEHDLFVAQGYVQAQDRLWQMEMNRRLASGRLSEVFGPDGLDADKVLRSLGFMRAARDEVASCDAATMDILNAFSAGVNAFIESRKSRLPMEFRILGIAPEPWKPEDSAVWGKFMAYTGGKNWQEEIVRSSLTERLGGERSCDLLKRINPCLPRMSGPMRNGAFEVFSHVSHAPFVSLLGGASNNWVVHGSRTTSGLPLLANDMHLTLTIPSVLYEMHLSCGEMDVIGVSLPGAPLIIAGHNRHLAWGITFAYTDVQDIFLERFDPEGRYLFRDDWVEPKLIREEIRVKGREDPVIHQIQVTGHGPIISPLIGQKEKRGHAFALKWSAHEPGTTTRALYLLNHARNWEDFKAGAAKWCEPAVNLVYADVEGNIGYVLGSRIPIRSGGHGLGPFKGWTGEFEWSGYLPSDKKPFTLNPEAGYFATANNDVLGPDFPHYLAVDYASDDRVKRIQQVLSKKNPVSMQDCRSLQGDFRSLSAGSFLSAIQKAGVKSPEAMGLLEVLLGWDQMLNPESAGAAIYSVLFQRLLENTFKDELGPLMRGFSGIGLTALDSLNRFVEHSRTILLDLMSSPESPWFDDIETEKRENLSDILEKSLLETGKFLRERLGPDRSGWRWGKLHSVDVSHMLGRRKPLDRLLNLGPYEGGGDFSTVWQTGRIPGMDFSLKGWSAANRHIYDLRNWDESLGAIVPGQSGLPLGRHYGDQMELWLKVGHHPLYFSRSKVESEAVARLVLKP